MTEPGTYHVENGRIRTWSLESHVVDHCNLACDQCCTLSPELDPWCVALPDFEADLDRAKGVLWPSIFKITGGEPLLHPQVTELVEAVRRAAIADQIQVTTNGFFIDRLEAPFWSSIDRLTLSLYPSKPLPHALKVRIQEHCRDHGVMLNVKAVDRFAVMNAAPPWHSPEAAEAMHRDCWLKVRCHMIYRGRFYACTRPPHLEPVLARIGVVESLSASDGVDLSGPDLGKRILRLLESDEPLEACRFCMGASGGFLPHRQVSDHDETAFASPR